MATFKVTAVPDFSQLKSEVVSLQQTPIKIKVDVQPAQISVQKVHQEMNQLADATDKTGGSVSALFTKIAAVSPIYAMVRAFQSALGTMKAVNDELIAIQKVTGYTTQRMDTLTEAAYKLAAQYGRTADEVLSAATTFARAGYGDQIESLAELSLLTQNVGDVSADTASQFLIAADAAWNLGGNEKELTAILDGLNEVTNRNAVDLEALTSGITLAGSVFAEAGESAQTFAGLIGAAVAATQRSGSEVARALRTILMNIRQIRGELDDGELVNGESIAAASNALKSYAGISTMTNGQLRLASAVLDELAGKWKSLDNVAQSAISEALAGKRQANVLSALMNGWETVGKAIKEYADGAGSALAENEQYLQGWTAKSKQLDAAWTEFVSHLIDTGIITGALDTLTAAIDLLDTDLGRTITTTAAVSAGFAKVAAAIRAAKKAAGAMNLASLNPWVLGIAAIGAAIGVVAEATKELRMSYEELDAEVAGNTEKLEANRQKIEEINNTPWSEKTSAILAEREALEAENRELEKQIEYYTQLEAKKAKSQLKNANRSVQEEYGNNFVVYSGTSYYSMLTEELRTYQRELDETRKISEENISQFEQSQSEAAALAAAIDILGYNSEDVTDEQRAMYDAFMAMEVAYDFAVDGAQSYVSSLIEEARQSGKTEKELYDLVAAQITASNTKLNFSQQIMALQQLAETAGYAGNVLTNMFALAGINEANVKRTAAGLMQTGKYSSYEAAYAEALRRAQQAMLYQFGNMTSTAPSGGWGGSAGGGSSGSSGGGSSGESALRKKAQAEIDALKKARDAETAAIDEQIEALKKQNEETERGEKLEELKLNILKKQDALLNARNERAVRQYNAATGQWEWVADPSKVKKVEEDLEDAKKDLRDYEREVELDVALSELEARKKAIEEAYQIKIDAWNDYLNGLADAVKREEELLEGSKKNNQNNGVQGNGGNNGSNNTGSNAGISAGVDSIFGDTGQSNLNKWKDTKAGDIISNVTGGTGSMNKGAGATGSGSGGKVTQSEIERTAKGLMQTGKYKNYDAALKEAKRRAGVYDSGGVLHGMGGIKATMRDEMVLPPDITAKMLRPSAEPMFRRRMDELRYIYGVTQTAQGFAGSVVNNDRHDVVNNYIVSDITMTREQASALTMDKLMEMAFHTKSYGGR